MAREEELQLDSKSGPDNGGGNLTKTRIYVGGLGGTVTEDDLRKTFSPLGILESVEIVRTKNRSFAYLDFLPSSDKSLSKLFSTYNGCIWKGGRLRLEKAKEHYLVRMKREWVEEAQLANKVPASKDDLSQNTVSFEKSKKVLAAEKPQLRFFFPKLMKMKSLPFTGTGKHKYSFQRIQLPSHPLHFCDCEEHSNPSEINKEKSFVDLEIKHGGINEQELDMMNSVMNKFLEKKNPPMDTGGKSQLAEEGGSLSSSSIDEMLVDENEEENQADSDEDNIVINIVAGGNDRTTSYQGSNLNKPRSSKQKAAQKNTIPYDKKRKSPFTEESEKNDIPAFAPKKKNISKTTSSEPADQTKSTQQSTQKPRWKNLVGKSENTQFSISQILPEVPSSKESQPKNNKHGNSESQLGPLNEVKEPENQPKITRHGNSESQLGPVNEVKEPKININHGVAKEGLLKDLSSESQLATSKEVTEADEAAPVVPSAVPSSTSGRGAAWKQKSSWTQLISNTTARSFSISQVLPGLTFESQRVIEEPNVETTDLKGECSRTFEVASSKEKNVVGPEVEASSSEKKLANVGEKNEVLGKMKEAIVGEIWNGETCPFMRSEASMKEWMKTKTALSGSLKKKGNDK